MRPTFTTDIFIKCRMFLSIITFLAYINHNSDNDLIFDVVLNIFLYAFIFKNVTTFTDIGYVCYYLCRYVLKINNV